MLKKNVRIQLYRDGEMVSERLVSQGPEFYNGPKEKHDGPVRIEFTLENREDAQEAVLYLGKLLLDLPIKETTTGTRGRKPNELNNDSLNSVDKDQLVKDFLEKTSDQDELIKLMRESGFIFVESGFLKHIIPEKYEIKERHLENYQWLIRRTKEAKDPKNDKFDPQILIGIKIMGKERDEKVVIYTYGKFKKSISIMLPEKGAMSFKKTNLIKYPHYMNEEERMKWGTEHRLLFNNESRKPSKFYMRWANDIKVGNELHIDAEQLEKRHAKDSD